MRPRRDSATWASSLGILGILVTALGQLALAPVLKHSLGADGLGLWLLLQQSFNLCLLAELGMSDGAVKILAEGRGSPDHARLVASARVLGWIAGTCVLAVCLVADTALLALGNIPRQLWIDAVATAGLLAIWGLVRFPMRLPLRLRYADGAVASYGAYEMVIGALRPALAATIALWLWPSCTGAAVGFIIGEFLPLFVAGRRHPGKPAEKPDRAVLWRMWRLGLGTSAWSLGTVAVPYLIVLILGFQAAPASIAAFQCSILAGTMMLRIALIPTSAVFPSWVAWRTAGNRRLVPPHGAALLRWGLPSLILAGIILIAANPRFVAWWVGPDLYAGDAVNVCWAACCIGWVVMGVLVQLHRVWFDRLGHLIAPLALPATLVLVTAIAKPDLGDRPALPLLVAALAGLTLTCLILAIGIRTADRDHT